MTTVEKQIEFRDKIILGLRKFTKNLLNLRSRKKPRLLL